MRPLTAMGEVHWRTPGQLSLLANSDLPVSPSTAVRLPPFAYQTMALLLPSLVVAIGEVTVPPSGAHHSALAVGGEPAVSNTEITDFPPPPPGQAAPLSVVITMCVPLAVLYVAGEV